MLEKMLSDPRIQELAREFQDRIIASSRKGIFISYSRFDKSEADRIALGLAHYGFAAWIDRVEIDQVEISDDELAQRLRAGIEKADCFLIILSEHAISRPWVKWEYEEAIRQQNSGKELLILHVLTNNCNVPDELRQTGRIDMRKGFDSAIMDIVSHFGIHIEAKRDSPFVSAKPQHKNLGQATDHIAALAYNQGLIAYQQGDFQTAIAKLLRAYELDTGCTDALYNCAVIHYELAMSRSDGAEFGPLIQETIRIYEQVIIVRPDDVDALVNLSAAYREGIQPRNVDRERALLMKAFLLTPDYALVWLNMGHFYARNGGMDDIQRYFTNRNSKVDISVDISQLLAAKQCYIKASELDHAVSMKSQTDKLCYITDQIIAMVQASNDNN